jgi:hypothetical protein
MMNFLDGSFKEISQTVSDQSIEILSEPKKILQALSAKSWKVILY